MMMASRAGSTLVRLASAGATLLLLMSCAKVGPPPGGPEDKTGPSLIETFPASDSVGVSRMMVARLVFSEPVNRETVEAALFLSPDPLQRLHYRWRGRTLQLIYLDSLDADRTYVISVGSQARDLHGNPMEASQTIAFSTGDHIDRGRIEGWVGSFETPQAVSLWAFQMSGDSSPDPMVHRADYRLQAGRDGRFQFAFLRPGRYRVYAVTDRNFDGLWNPASELIGVPPWDVTVSDSTMPWVSFRLSDQDTSPVAIRGARMVHQGQIELRMNRPVTTVSSWFEKASGDTVGQLYARPDTSGQQLWQVFPRSFLEAGPWFIKASGRDDFGGFWEDTSSVEVRARADTTRPHLLSSYPASRTRAREIPDSVQLVFDEPVSLDSLGRGDLQLVASDSDTVAATFRANDAVTLIVVPAALARGTDYRLRLYGPRLRDAAGNALADSLWELSFGIYASDSLGALRGQIAASEAGRYMLSARRVKGGGDVAYETVTGPGSFEIDRLPAGQYVLQVARDADGDHAFSFGRLRPFRFSDPFLQSPDTVTIRVRWEYETTVQWRDNPR